jgi:hypothetical protein
MAEAASFGTVATIVTAVGAGTGAVAVPALAAFGIDASSVGAGLLGCAIVQMLSPPEQVTFLRVAATAFGSMLVASFGAPYIAPLFAVNGSVTHEHANAVASALLGGSAKPVVLVVKARFETWFANWLPPGSKPKGSDDA